MKSYNQSSKANNQSSFRLITLLKLAFIFCIQGLLGLQSVYAATYYVSPSGVDTNAGISPLEPVRTINMALSKARMSGDIVYVMSGTYTEAVTIDQNGITLSAYPGHSPVIDGDNTLPNWNWGALIHITGNYNIVSNFEVKNSNINGKGGRGVWLEGHHNTVRNMNIHHIWQQGVWVEGDFNIVADSKIWQAARVNQGNAGQITEGWPAGISAARNLTSEAIKPGINSYTTLRHNTVSNNWGEGLSCFEADYCTLEDNIVYDNWTHNLYLSDATNSVVQRNMVYASSDPAINTRFSVQAGITLADELTDKPRSANNTVINNFIYNADLHAFYWTLVSNSGLRNVLIANNTIIDGGLFTGSGNIVNTNSEIRNNIILGVDSYVPNKSGITFSHNNWSAFPPPAAASITDVVGDPQITRTGSTLPGALKPTYFEVHESSPVIGAALSLASVTEDFYQVARGAAPSIGGYEFHISDTNSNSTVSPPSSTSSTEDLTLSGLEPNNVRAGKTIIATVTGSGFAPDIQVQLRNGTGPAPAIIQVVWVDDATLQVTIETKRRGPARPRAWDVVVINPDGGSAVLAEGLVVMP